MGVRQRNELKQQLAKIESRIGASLGVDSRNQFELQSAVDTFRGSKSAGEILGAGGQARIEKEIFARSDLNFQFDPSNPFPKRNTNIPDPSALATRFKRLDAALTARRQQREGSGGAAQSHNVRRALAMSRNRMGSTLGTGDDPGRKSVLGGGL